MKEEQDPLNELYRKILHGNAHPEEKENLVRWMTELNLEREEISPEELMAENERSRRELRAHFSHQRRNTTLIRSLLVAASVAAAIIVFFRIKSDPPVTSSYAVSNTIAGERKVLTFEDGSKIWMNSASSIRYPLSFKGKTREIFLDGEAYFEVNHDKTRPFIVHTGKLAVQVLGTTFDVRNYREDADAAITVTSGKVAVETMVLTAGCQLVYDKKTGTHIIDHVVWKQGVQVFNNQELQEICRILERSYGVKIYIKTAALKTRKLNFRIKGGENISSVMEMLSATGEFHYSIKDKNIIVFT